MTSTFKLRKLPAKKSNRGRKPSEFREHESHNQCQGIVNQPPSKGGKHRCLNKKMKGSNFCKRHSGTWTGASNHKAEYNEIFWKSVAKEYLRQIERTYTDLDPCPAKNELGVILILFKKKLSQDEKKS